MSCEKNDLRWRGHGCHASSPNATFFDLFDIAVGLLVLLLWGLPPLLTRPFQFICVCVCSSPLSSLNGLCSSNHSHMCYLSFWVTVLAESDGPQYAVIRVCVCVCVCERVRVRDREGNTSWETRAILESITWSDLVKKNHRPVSCFLSLGDTHCSHTFWISPVFCPKKSGFTANSVH